MAQPSPAAIEALRALSGHAELAAPLCAAAADGAWRGPADLRQICECAGIASARASQVRRCLALACDIGLFAPCSALAWRPVADPQHFAELAPMLFAVALYRDTLHTEDDTVDVVLTNPPEPSQLVAALEAMLQGAWGILPSKQVFPDLASQARHRFCVMSPFLDAEGGEFVAELFGRTAPSVTRQLILRGTPDGQLPAGYTAAAPALAALNTQIFNFRLVRARQGTETFHAKVVLADDNACYIGSSNMTKWSLDYSLELGLVVRGQAAGRVARVLNAVMSVATPRHQWC